MMYKYTTNYNAKQYPICGICNSDKNDYIVYMKKKYCKGNSAATRFDVTHGGVDIENEDILKAIARENVRQTIKDAADKHFNT